MIYDGIHYDPLELTNSAGTPVQRIFNVEDDAYIAAARHVGDEARKVIKNGLCMMDFHALFCVFKAISF